MKIRKLQLKNIGVFDDETIEFHPCPARDKAEIHIFTGENGSGKSTILQGIAKIFHAETNLPPEDSSFTISGMNNIVIYGNTDKDVFGNERSKVIDNYHKYLISQNSSFFLDMEHNKEIETDIEIFRGKRNNFNTKFKSKSNKVLKALRMQRMTDEYDFAVFAYAGYRRIRDEKINLFEEVPEHPFHQALEFIKNESSKFTINQWLGRNLSKRALSLEDKSEDINKFAENIKNLEKVIADIVGYDIRFKLKTDLSLVLIKNSKELDFDVLPDGLKSLISWIGDLLMRLDSVNWKNDTPIFEREIILFLDEIEVHLHPAWQRKVLPVVQKLFKNAQIFVSTHSPFVVNSVDDAWVYKLELENGKAKVAEVVKSEDGISYQTVLREIFGVDEEFGGKTQEDLNKFYKIVRNGKTINEKDLKKLAKSLAEQSEELNTIVQIELRQLSRRRGKEISL